MKVMVTYFGAPPYPSFMKFKLFTAVIFILGVALLCAPLTGVYDEWSPFQGIRFDCHDIEVKLDANGDWGTLESVDGKSVSSFVDFALDEYDDYWRPRIVGDFGRAIREFGSYPVLPKVNLVVDGTAHSVWLSSSQRPALYRSLMASERPKIVRNRHAPDKNYEFLTRNYQFAITDKLITRAEAYTDLDILEAKIQDYFAYKNLRNDFDYRKAIDTIRHGIDSTVDRRNFAIQVNKLINLFGDGHAGVRRKPYPKGYLPFLVSKSGPPVAFKDDRSSLLDPQFPLVAKIDNVNVSNWFEAAMQHVPKGHDDAMMRDARRVLRNINLLRQDLNLPVKKEITVLLTTPDHSLSKKIVLTVAEKKPFYGTWPRPDYRPVLPNNIAYIRIDDMSDEREYIEDIETRLDQAQKYDGVILDIRGNTGGSRDLVKKVVPYFMQPDAGPKVVNAAKFRTPPLDRGCQADIGYLINRSLHPIDSPKLNSSERESIEVFSRTFAPVWNPPESDFSSWHYFVLTPKMNGNLSEKRVIVIQSIDNFSAADILLGAFKILPHIKRIGGKSSGGSARSEKYYLPNSRFEIKLASMASFQADGLTFDGVGVPAHKEVAPTSGYYVGKEDPFIEAAIKELTN